MKVKKSENLLKMEKRLQIKLPKVLGAKIGLFDKFLGKYV